MKITKNFYLQEFIPMDMYNEYGSRAAGVMDYRIILSAQALRDNLGIPLSINTWHSCGERYESGLRVMGMKNYRPLSQHTYGRAVDIVSNKMPAQEMREHILQNRDKYPYITRMENNVTWLHIDIKDTQQEDIILFNP